MVFKILGIFWIVTGFIALVLGVKAMNDSEIQDSIREHLEVIHEEFHIKREDCICVLYVSFVLCGFIGVSLVALRKLKNILKGERNAK